MKIYKVFTRMRKFICRLLAIVIVLQAIPFNIYVDAITEEFGPFINKTENTISNSVSNSNTNSVITDENSNVNTEGNNDVEENPSTSEPPTSVVIPDESETPDDTLIGDVITTEDGYRVQMNGDGKSYSIIEYFGVSKKVEIPATYRGLPITKILDTAFYGNKTAQKIIIPESVIFVGEYTFYNLGESYSYNKYSGGNYIGSVNNPYYYFVGPTDTNITEITLHDDTVIVGSYAFDKCENLKEVEIGNNVISMGYAVFGKASKVEKITIPFIGENGKNDQNAHFGYIFGARTIGGNISYVPLTLKEVVINGGSYIKHNAMYGVDMIEKLTLPFLGSNIKDTENNYFSYIFGGTSYEDNIVPQSVKNVSILGGEIGYGAFYKAVCIEKINIGEKVTKIGDYAFYNTSLTEIFIHKNITNIGANAFVSNVGFNTITVDEENEYYYSENNCLIDKTTKTLMLGSNNTIIPNDVTAIYTNAFYNCTSLTGIEIPSSVTSIGSNAFYNCTSLESITLPFVGNTLNGTSNTHFGYIFGASSYSYNGDYVPTSLKEVIITGGTSVDSSTFYNCTSLESIELPNSVTSIGSYAFYNCTNLKNVYYNGTIEAWCNITFSDKYSNPMYYVSNFYMLDENNEYYEPTEIEIPDTVTSIGNYQFYNFRDLIKITIPNSVTSIGEYAFYNCTSLTSIELPNSVTSIGFSSFYGCTSLESITIPFVGKISVNGIIYANFGYLFGTWSYSDISTYVPTSLKEVIITGGTSIGNYAFYNCTNLESVVIPNSITSIGEYAFYGCTGLTSIELPNNIQSIDDYAFYNCTNLIQKVEGVSYVNNWVIECDESLTQVLLKENIVGIANNSFLDCKNLQYNIYDNAKYLGNEENPYLVLVEAITNDITSCIINANTRIISYSAFSGCIGLTSIEIPTSVTNICSSAFSGCSIYEIINNSDLIFEFGSEEYGNIAQNALLIVDKNGEETCKEDNIIKDDFIFIIEDNKYKLIAYIGQEDTVTLPLDINGEKYSIYQMTGVKNVIIPEGFTEINDYAFYDCTTLDSITIPNSVASIGEWAFYGCTTLESITLPFIGATLDGTSNTHFGYLFGGENRIPTSLKEVIITDGKSIDEFAFNNCTSIESIVLSNSIMSIGVAAFRDCKSLKDVYYNGTIEEWCNIKFESSNSNPMYYAENFYMKDSNNEWYEVTEIEIPDVVTSIENYQFWGFDNITKVTISNTVISIANWAFYNCTSLESITIPFVGNTLNGTSNTHFGYIFGASSYSDNNTYVPTSLKEVIITGGTNIGSGAFYYCENIEMITIPNSITAMGVSAFSYCTSLEDVYYKGIIEDWCNIIFEDEYSNPMSYVSNFYMKDSNNEWYEVTSLTKLEIPNSVTSIGLGALSGCTSLESITIPFVGNTLNGTSNTHFGYIFGASSYYYNNTYVPTSLNEVIITGGTSIGQSAFYNCTNLESVVIPNSITSIGYRAFQNCTNLESITIPFVGNTLNGTSNTHLGYIFGSSTYSYNSTYVPASLKGVIITGGTNIGSNAFSSCKNITSIELPNSVTSIGFDAFYGCQSLKNAYYDGTENTWNTNVYISSGNERLTNVLRFEENNSTEEVSTFIVSKNKKIYLSNNENVSFTTSNSILLSETLEFISNGDGTCVIIGIGTFDGTELVIPKMAPNGDIVVEIASYAFSSCTSLEEVIFEENSQLMSIGSYAFYDCTSLESIEIPNSVTSIGSNAFYNCTSLESITLPFVGNTLNGISNTHFGYIFGASTYFWNFSNVPTSLKKVIITGGTNIDYYAFYNCTSLESITLPFVGNTLNGTSNTHFGYIFGASSYSYNGDYVPTSLKEVIITGGTSVDSSTFYNCENIKSITIPKSVVSIDSSAFYGCRSLTDVYYNGTISNWCNITLENANSNPMGWATNFYMLNESNEYYEPTEIEIPDTVTSIGNYQFYNFRDLIKITIPNSVTSIGEYAFYNCTSLTDVYYSGTIEDWYDITFRDVYSRPMYYANNLYIKDNNNEWYKPTEIEIPDTIASIEQYLFYNCASLTSIEIPYSVTSIGSYAFYNCTNLKNVYYNGTIEEWCNIKFESSNSNPMYYAENFYMKDSNNEWYEVTEIEIPDVVTSIENYQFWGFDNITKVTISNTVISIANWAFYNCTSLESITIPFVGNTLNGTSNTHFGYIFGASSYYYNNTYVPTSLKEVIITGGICIDDNAFGGCSGILEITLSNSIARVGSNVFQNCTNLQKIYYDGEYNEWRHVTKNSDWNNGISIERPECLKEDSGVLYETSDDFEEFYVSGYVGNSGNVVIPELYSGRLVTAIWERTFDGNEVLTAITLPDSIHVIEEYAFKNCINLEKINFPENLNTIENGILYGCTNIQELELPFLGAIRDYENNEFLGYYFGGKDYTENIIYVPETLQKVTVLDAEKISDYCFADAVGLTEFVIPDSVSQVGIKILEGCNNITSITIGASLESIADNKYGYSLFGINKSTSMLKEYIVSSENKSFTSDEYGVLYRTMDITYSKGTESVRVEIVDVPTMANLSGYVIPDHIVSIAPYAFAYNTSLRMIDLTYVRRIANNAFYQASNLVNVTLGTPIYTEFEKEEEFDSAIDNAIEEMKENMNEGMWEQVYYQYIGDSAFRGCHSLLKIDIDTDNIIGIGDYAFADCPKLKTIMLGKNIEKLGLAVFGSTASGDSNIERFVVDEDNTHFKSIDGVLYSVNSDNSLTLEIFPSMAVVLDIYNEPMYDENNNLLYKETFELPKGVYLKAIQTYAFQGTKELKHVILRPDDELIVGDYAFANSSIQTIIVGDNVSSLGLIRGEGEYTVFADADYLTEIKVDDNNEYYSDIDGVLFDKNQQTLIKYPAAMLGIEYNIPTSVQSIASMAFKQNQEIEKVNISSYISTIGLEAFYACGNLKSISFKDVYAPLSIMENAFTTFVEIENVESVDPKTTIGYSLAYYYNGTNGEKGWENYAKTYRLVENTSGEIVDPQPEEDNNKFYAIVVVDTEGNQLADMLVSITDPFEKTETVRTSSGPEGKGTAMFYDLSGTEGVGFTLDFTLPYSIKVADQRGIYYTYESSKIYLDEDMCVTYITLVRKPCDVTFNINGGVGYIETIDILVGEDPVTGEAFIYDIDNTEVSRAGYTLAGWGTSADGVVKYTDTFSTNKYKAHYVLYAIWEPNINTVHFDINSGDNGEMVDVYVKTDASIDLPKNSFKKEGYEFIGWALSPNGGVEYDDNDVFTSGPNSGYTLYAKWKGNENIFQFVSGGGKGSMNSSIVVTDEEVIVPENEFTRDGYTFSHWLDDNGNSLNPGDKYKGTTKPVQTLTAIWTPNVGILSFNANSASGNMPSIELATDEKINLPKTEFDKLGYVILGWATTPNGAPEYDSTAEFKMPPVEVGEEVTLYAIWAKGATVHGVSCDQNDLNTEKFTLNKAGFDYECPIQGTHEHEEEIICENGIIRETARIGVIVYCDPSFGYSIYDENGLIDERNGLYQNGQKIASIAEVSSIDGESIIVYFDVLVYTLLTEVDITTNIVLVNERDEKTRCENVLNIHVIDFVVTEDDVNLETESMNIDLSKAGDAFVTLFGKSSFDFSLGKNVKVNTEINGDTVEITLNASKDFKKSSSVTTDYKKGYNDNHGAHNKNTYFFQYKATVKDSKGIKHNLVYNVRFARETEADNYYYYRCYIYEGKYSNKIAEFYGAVNGFNIKKTTRGELAPKAFLIYQTHLQNARKAKDIEKIKKLGKDAQYIEAVKNAPIKETSHSFNMGLEGKIILQYDKEKGLVPVSSRIKGTMEYTLKHNSQFVVWVIPITLDVEVKIGGEIVLNIGFDEDRKITFDDATATLTANIDASVGIGCSVASAGVYGKLGTVFVLDIYPDFGVESWKINGEIGGYVKVLFWKYTATFVSFDGYIIKPKDKQQTLMMMSSYNAASMYLIENYENAEASELENDFRLLVIDGKLYKLGYMDASSIEGYDEYNYAKLCISSWNGEEWSEPLIIDNNGRNDASFSIYNQDDEVILTYTQIADVITENDDNYDTCDKLVIKTISLTPQAIADMKNGQTIDTYVERENYIYLSQYVEVDGIPTLVWAENADNNAFGVSPDNYIDANGVSHVFETKANSIWKSTYDTENGIWNTSELIAKDLSAITDIAVGTDGNIAYIVDTNGDLADMTDRVMYYGNMNGTIMPYNHTSVGSILDVNFQEGEFVYYYDVLNETDEEGDGLRTISNSETIEEYPNYIPATHKAVLDKYGNVMAIFYFDTKSWKEDDIDVSGSTLYGVFKEDGVWGKPIEIIDPNSIRDESNQYFKPMMDRYIYAYDVVVDPNNDNSLMVSVSTFDNEGSYIEKYDFSYQMNGELILNDYEIAYSNSAITITVQNIGATSTPVYISTGSEYSILEENLPSGEIATYTISLLGNADKLYDISIDRDKEGEADWSITVDLNYSDLVPYAKQLLIGEDNVLLVAIRNKGNKTDTGFTVIRLGEYMANEIISDEILDVLSSIILNDGESIFVEFINEEGENEKIWVAKSTLDKNDIIYYEVSLSELSSDNNIELISIATTISENEKGVASENNYAYVSYNECIGSLEGDEKVSYDPVIFEDRVEFDYMNNDSIEFNYTCGIEDSITDIYIDEVKVPTEMYENIFENARGNVTIYSEFLNTLSYDKHTIKVIFGSEKSCEIELKVIPYYTVTILDGTDIIDEITVKEGDIPELPTDLTKEANNMFTYEFNGWDVDFDEYADGITKVTEDIIYRALWKENLREYVISWVMVSSEGNTITINETYNYDDIPNYLGTIYEPDSMKFVSWDSEITSVTEDYSYIAQYEEENQGEDINITAGDINGDDKVNNKDFSRLFQYIAGWEVEVNEKTLDVNGDGKVNNKDLTRLFQYLANWDVELKISSTETLSAQDDIE